MIKVNGAEVEEGEGIVIQKPSNLVIESGQSNYTFEIKERIQLNAIFISENEGELRVHVR